MIETSVSAKTKLSVRECRASNILFFKLKKKKNQPNLASENKRERERVRINAWAREKSKKRKKLPQFHNQDRERKKGTEKEQNERERLRIVSPCSRRATNLHVRGNVILWRHRKWENARSVCWWGMNKSKQAGCFNLTRHFRTIFWPFIYLIFGLQSGKGRTGTYQNFLVNFLANLFSNNFYTSVETGGIFKPSEQYKQN